MAVTRIARPTLESGDRLTQAEFHRRYSERPDIKKAELVEGVVYVASPVSALHSGPLGSVAAWLGAYRSRHLDLRLDIDPTVLLGDDNELQPDACLWREQPGGPRVNEQGYIEGAPQLVVEVAVSSAAYDLYDKKEAYRRNRVREYIVWRANDGLIHWFRLQADEYAEMYPDDDGAIESTTFPGLRLNVGAMVAGDLGRVLRELDWAAERDAG